ncbi:serpin family protein [Endozoicomonas sp. ONNA2]|uniref:serpin family protein n=1 Tax=Endozoicomonas sp. ONNA2 TaxID=2828741 RepID=UPI00214803D1|nr:serpin family protein [Endozoicomonas sp. ONNA2]
MNFRPAFSPPPQYSPTIASNSAQPLTDSSYCKVCRSPNHLCNLKSDVRIFMEIAKREKINNVVVSPLLVSSAENTARKVRELQESNSINHDDLMVVLKQSGNPITNTREPEQQGTPENLHFFSKNISIDMVMKHLGVPFTSSHELAQQGYDSATQQLNDRIANDTNGVITDLLKPEMLTDPKVAYVLVSWLFQNVSWKEPFVAIPQGYGRHITWNGKEQSEIVWMQSEQVTNAIAYKNISGFQFIALPVKESGLKAVFIMPPETAKQEHSDKASDIIAEGLNSLFEGQFTDARIGLVLPKYEFEYVYEKEYPELIGGKSKHQANLSIKEAGAFVAAAFVMRGGAIPKKLYINKSFYFAMITHEGKHKRDPRLVGIAHIEQPWEPRE